MQQEMKTAHGNRNMEGNRRRIESVVETLATIRGRGESLSEVAHDARNMVTALGLYCDLLDEPGVLAIPYLHYGQELRLVTAASRRLVEKLVALDGQVATKQAPGARQQAGVTYSPAAPGTHSGIGGTSDVCSFEGPTLGSDSSRCQDLLPAVPVANLAAELLANRNLLSALAGPAIALTVETDGGAKPVRLTGEDLTRVLVNLVKNAAEAMPAGGRVHLNLSEQPSANGAAACMTLAIENNGPAIAEDALESVFNPGYTTRGGRGDGSGWALGHRGLGLAITRSIVEAAGGRIRARNRMRGGVRFEIELPLRKGSL